MSIQLHTYLYFQSYSIAPDPTDGQTPVDNKAMLRGICVVTAPSNSNHKTVTIITCFVGDTF